MSVGKLTEVIHGLVEGQMTTAELSGGLRMQFKAAEDRGHLNRLLCYRIGHVGPSVRELAIVRRHLEQLRPNARIVLGDGFEYVGSDGRTRHCRVFSWYPVVQAQATLGGV